jgi:hypothetical protein
MVGKTRLTRDDRTLPLPNVSQEATGDAARFAGDGAGVQGGKSWPIG